MYHLDTGNPQGILYKLCFPQHCRTPQHMEWVLKQDSHNGNLLGRWDILFVLCCCYRNQHHKVLVIGLYRGNKTQQDIPINQNKKYSVKTFLLKYCSVYKLNPKCVWNVSGNAPVSCWPIFSLSLVTASKVFPFPNFFPKVVDRKAKILVLPGRLLHQIGQSCHYNNLLDKLLSYSFLQDNCIIKHINHVTNGHHSTIQKMMSHSQDHTCNRGLSMGWGGGTLVPSLNFKTLCFIVLRNKLCPWQDFILFLYLYFSMSLSQFQSTLVSFSHLIC